MSEKSNGVKASTETRLWVGGLSPEVTEEELGKRFHLFGTVLDIEIIRDTLDSNLCRGFGYVTLHARAGDLAKCLKVCP